MKNKKTWYISISFTCILVTFICIYLGLAFYYGEGFSYGTFINGVYCTGKSIEEINKEIIESFSYKDIKIVELNENTSMISMGEIGYEVDFTKPLQLILKNQNPLLWICNVFSNGYYEIFPEGNYDDNLLTEAINNLPCIKEELKKTKRKVTITKTSNGYELMDETKNVLQVKQAIVAIKLAILEGQPMVSLSSHHCYQDLSPTSKDIDTYHLWDKVNEFQDFHLIYDFGDSIEIINEAVVSNWITRSDTGEFLLDENDNLIVNQSKIEDYILNLADKYNTYGKQRQFIATNGDTVIIDGGTYGNELNVKTEVNFLTNAFENKLLETRIPEYIHKAIYQGLNDIGNTYIEIDTRNQELYFYKEGILTVETPVVTGNVRWKLPTPSKACFVVGKYKNCILKGPGYASQVDFWVPVYKNIGIHDAKWRSQFGGEIYKTNGSHGCINVPRKIMEELFKELEVGMPVIIY